jgi:branched-chain amino acid transport system substrate-binding protein
MAAFIAVVACGGSSPGTQQPKEPLVIGAALPLTGGFAAYGETWKNGVVLAQDEINASGGVNGRQLKIQIEDWATDTAKAVQALTKLAEVDKVPVVLGGGSGAILAQAPVANRSKVVLINAAAQTPAMRKVLGQFGFTNINDANAEADDLVRYMKEDLKITTADIYYVDDATGKGQKDGLELAAKNYNVSIIESLSHSFSDNNYRNVINKMKGSKPPAVLVGSHWEQTGYTLKQAAEVGFKPTWLGLSPTESDVTVKIAGKDAIEGFLTIRSEFDAKKDQGTTKKFIDAYKKRFNTDPDVYAAHFYDAVYMTKAAALAGATDGASFAKAFAAYTQKKPFTGGVSGEVGFDAEHMVRQPSYIFVVKNGELSLVKKLTVPTS